MIVVESVGGPDITGAPSNTLSEFHGHAWVSMRGILYLGTWNKTKRFFGKN
jgi:hypothetical protein